MARLDPLALAGAKAKGKRPFFLDSADDERLLNILLVVVQELAVTRERMDTIERLLAHKGVLTAADIEGFAPSKAEADARGAWTQDYIARIFRILQQDKEALLTDDDSAEEVADELAKV